MPRRILITPVPASAAPPRPGGSAAPASNVTVVERAPAFRDGGQNVDVRGIGRTILREMGLERAALARGTGEEGTAWVGRHGPARARFMAGETEGEGPTAEMEILRGDLARLLYEASTGHAAYRFGDGIARVEEDGTVAFAGGGTARYDAVIVAEGVGSATRERVFPGENDPRWMD